MLPDELMEVLKLHGGPLRDRLPRFFLQDVTVRLDDGRPLPGFVKTMEGRKRLRRDEITGEPLPQILERKASAFTGEHLNLTVHGEAAKPQFDRINFLRRNLRTSTVVNPREELDVHSTTLGAIYVLPVAGLPVMRS